MKTWLLGIAVNVCRELRRSIARMPNAGLGEEAVANVGDPSVESGKREEIAHLHETLDRLSSRQREVIVLRYFEELSVAETSEVLGVSTGTIKATTFQALSLMRRSLVPCQEVM